MKSDEFKNTIQNIPVYRAVFRLISQYDGYFGCEEGEIFLVYADDPTTFIRKRDGHRFRLSPSYMRFIAYQRIPSWDEVQEKPGAVSHGC